MRIDTMEIPGWGWEDSNLESDYEDRFFIEDEEDGDGPFWGWGWDEDPED